MNKPEFLTRTITGVFIGAISLSAIIFSPWTYLAWLCLIAYLGTREYLKLGKDSIGYSQGADMPFLILFMVIGTGYSLLKGIDFVPILLLIPVLISGRFIIQLLAVKEVSELVKNTKSVYSVVAYIAIPILAGCVFLYGIYSWKYILIPVILIWINDIGAYMIGSQWGKHKIAPAISPGKSIEGTIGGGLATIAAGFILRVVWPEIPLYYIGILSLATPLFALAGDLWESALKRDAGVKDSGHLLPGHGGILDRYDSLLFVMPVAALAYFIFVL
ncbi:MAG TPA: phosphatidate cytidylyltransferase [Saprospiraceae bacterium]